MSVGNGDAGEDGTGVGEVENATGAGGAHIADDDIGGIPGHPFDADGAVEDDAFRCRVLAGGTVDGRA